MNIVTLTYEGLVANTHLAFIDVDTVIAFDVGQENASLIKYLKKHNLTLAAVFLTHGHLDHIRGLSFIDEEVPVYIGAADEVMLRDPHLNLSSKYPPLINLSRPVKALLDQDCIVLKNHHIVCLSTPFHTLGSCCYLIDDSALISGDTLFKMSIGRDDLIHACPRKKQESLRKLLFIEKEMPIYPGHGPNSTLFYEKQHNPYLKNI